MNKRRPTRANVDSGLPILCSEHGAQLKEEIPENPLIVRVSTKLTVAEGLEVGV
jgi:hypothetical protein